MIALTCAGNDRTIAAAGPRTFCAGTADRALTDAGSFATEAFVASGTFAA
jgi:hypothetical protein